MTAPGGGRRGRPLWRSLRLRRWLFWSLLLAALVVRRFAWGVEVPAVVPAALFVALVAVIAWSALLRCPRCRQLFRWGGSGGFAPWRTACAHCGLPIGEVDRWTA